MRAVSIASLMSVRSLRFELSVDGRVFIYFSVRILILRYQTASPWSCSRMWPLAVSPKPFVFLNLLRRCVVSTSAALEFEDLDAVQPVLDVIAFDYDARSVEFALWFELLALVLPGSGRRAIGGAIARDARLGVRMIFVIQHLVFKTDAGSAGLAAGFRRSDT